MILSTRFSDALVYAAGLHAQQHRKVSGEPYLAHLLGVAAIALQYGADENEAIAALLHDAVEDQGGPTTREEIRHRFGPEVVEIVDGCTDADTTPKPPWHRRKQTYVQRLRYASASVRLVSAADKLHNVRALLQQYRLRGESLWGHFRGGRDGTLWYYRAVVDALKGSGTTPLVEELQRTVDQLVGLVATAAGPLNESSRDSC
ncbi:MAG: HD domain-containing protein [Pirellulales bacterium]|nr:HD domain-containing protein [Pirellulales bacterium]